MLSKSLLRRIRLHPVAEPNRHLLATHLLTAHDAVEIALAAIADERERLPADKDWNLMRCLASLKELHPGQEVPGTGYFRRLNQARIGVKHFGNLPDPQQWDRLGDTVYGHVSEWCTQYLGLSFEELDESALLASDEVRRYFGSAKQAMAEQNSERVLVEIAFALHTVFMESGAVWSLQVGTPKAEDAIRLTGFGVHANDFLALQEFLPLVGENEAGGLTHTWKVENYGHPGNWTAANADFCLNAFLDVALKVQDARRIPTAVPFGVLYEYKVTAVRDGVEVCKEVWEPAPGPVGLLSKRREAKSSSRTVPEGTLPLASLLPGRRRLECTKTLARGDSLRGSIRFDKYPAPATEGEQVEEVRVTASDGSGSVGIVLKQEVIITCVPRDNPFVKKYFPGLRELDFPSH